MMKKKKQWGEKWTEEKLDAFEKATGFIIKEAMPHVFVAQLLFSNNGYSKI